MIDPWAANILAAVEALNGAGYSTVTRLLSGSFKDDEVVLFQVPDELADEVFFVGAAPIGSEPEDLVWKVVKKWYDANGNIKRQAFREDMAWTERAYDWPGDGTRAFGTVTYIDPTIPVAFNIFENDVYPEDYGWSPEATAHELCVNLANWINGVFGEACTATVVDNVVTIKMDTVGTAGNANAVYGSDPEGAIASGQFTGGTEPWN